MGRSPLGASQCDHTACSLGPLARALRGNRAHPAGRLDHRGGAVDVSASARAAAQCHGIADCCSAGHPPRNSDLRSTVYRTMNDAAGGIKQDAVTPAVWASAFLKLDIQGRVRVLGPLLGLL